MRSLAQQKKTIAHPIYKNIFTMKNWISREHLGTKWIISFGFWILLGLLFASKSYIYSFIIDQPIYWWRAIDFTMPKAIVWGAVTPIVLWFASIYRIEAHNWVKNLLIHAAACLVLAPFLVMSSFLIDLLVKWIGSALPDNPSFVTAAFNAQIFANSFDNILTYIIIVGMYHVYEYYQRYRERELKAAKLEAQLATARIDLLKAQLNPHFLFNTLNAISIVKDKDLEMADQMITDLSEMLRFIMDNIHKQEVTLREEIDFLDRYISLQKKRFEEKLEFSTDIDPGSWNAMVPSLILQPLVENAIEHGIRNHTDGGKIDIKCVRDNNHLAFEIRDNGAGLQKKPSRNGKGIGVSNTRERLNALYGSDYTFELENRDEGGVSVTLKIPYRWDNNY
ncbi:MAG TPA: histidine kinase [Balneolales bacterium]|nr:histidine kinase [Balneolales bacterium]